MFTAVKLPADLRARLTAAAAPEVAQIAGARAVPADRMHVTVRFHGDVDPRMVARLRDDLRSAAAQAIGGLAVVRIAGGARLPRRVRVHRTRVDDVGGVLRRIKIAVSRAIAPLGAPSESRPCRAHDTFARVRRERGAAAPVLDPAAGAVAAEVPPGGECPVRELALVDCGRGADGACGRGRGRIALAAP